MRHSLRNNSDLARCLVASATVRAVGWRVKILGDESLNLEISDGLMANGTGAVEDRGMKRENPWRWEFEL